MGESSGVASTAPGQATVGALSQQVSRAMLWNTFWQVARLLAGLVSAVIVANVLPKDDYGTVVTISAMATTLGLISDLGIERGLAKFLPEIEDRYGRDGVRRTLTLVITQKLVVIALVVLLALLFREQLFAYWLERARDDATRATILRYSWLFFWALMALILFGALFDVYMQALTAYFRQRASGAIGFVVTILSPLLRVMVVLLGWGILGFVGALVTIPLVATGLAAWQSTTIRRALAEHPVVSATGAQLPRRFLGYTGLSFWQQVTEYLYSLDFILLVLPSAAAAASLKYVYSLISQILSGLWSPMLGVQIPLFARLYARGSVEQLREAYRLISKFLAAIMIPAATGLTLLAGNLIALLGTKYVDGIGAAQIFTLTLCLDAAISVPLAILMAYERYRPMAIARAWALLGLPVVFFAAPDLTLLRAALIMGGLRLICDGLAMILTIRYFQLRYPVAFAMRVLAASALMAAVVAPAAHFLSPPLSPDLHLENTTRVVYLAGNLLAVAVGALVYLGGFKLLGGIDPADRRRILELRLPLVGHLVRYL